jgi:hypothetical protein
MLLTAWCMVVVLGGPMLTGIPLAWLLNGRRPLGERDHVLAPFLGLSAIVLVLQNLVYLNLPVRWTAPLFWLLVLLGWLWLWRQGGLARPWPWPLLIVAVLVFLVHGAGLLVVGPLDYVARGYSDQCNYVCTAQFLSDEPFHTPLEALDHRVYMASVVSGLRSDRLGQSVLHAFYTVSSGLDARSLFQPTILLGPALTVFAVYGLARRFGLGNRPALVVGAAAALCPALALLQLECFLSHVLMLPFFVVFPLLLDALNERPSLAALARAALVLATVVACYTEIWLLLEGALVVSLVLGAWRHPRLWRLLGCGAALTVAPLVLNPAYAGMAVRLVAQRSTPWPNVLPHVYPWAYTSEGLGRLWLGDLVASGTAAVGLYAFTLTALALAGLALVCLQRLRAGKWPDLAFAASVLALALVPVPVLVLGRSYPYQFYKLLCTVSPLLFLGLRLLGQPGPVAAEAGAPSWRRRVVLPLAAAAFVLAALSTGRMAHQSSRTEPRDRFFAHFLYTPDMRQLRHSLPQLPRGNLVLAFQNPPFPHHYPHFLNSWLSYFGRQHRIWVADPIFIDQGHWKDLAAGFTDLGDLPEDARLLTAQCPGLREVDMGRPTLLWSGERFALWRCSDRAWAVPVSLSNPNGWGGTPAHPFFWVGNDPARLSVLAGRPGVVTLSGNLKRGPNLAASELAVRVRCSEYDRQFVTTGGHVSLTVPIPAGRSCITVEVLDRPTTRSLPNGDTRTLLQVVDLSFRYRPGTSAKR